MRSTLNVWPGAVMMDGGSNPTVISVAEAEVEIKNRLKPISKQNIFCFIVFRIFVFPFSILAFMKPFLV